MQPSLQWKNSKSDCICSPSYPACNVREQYFHLWPVWFYSIFTHYLKKGRDFREVFIEHEIYVSSFSVAFDGDIFHSKRKWARCDKKYILVNLMCG